MWEQIRANKLRSLFLISAMGTLLILLGFGIGLSVHPQFGPFGALAGMILWFVLWMVALFGGRDILLASAHAHQIEKADSPRFFNVVEEMTIASGLPRAPKVFIVDCDAPNAFAVGTPDNAAIAVTTGLLMYMNRDELQGVVAHEIGHIKNNDTRFMTQAGVMLAAIVILADAYLRATRGLGAGQRRSSGRGGGGAQLIIVLFVVVFALLAPLLAQLLYFACSRKREFLADACSAQYTRYPEGLASALEKISHDTALMPDVNRATAPMYIVNPLKGSAVQSLFSTHPATEERIRILRSIAGGAAYANYEQAYRRLRGRSLMSGATVGQGRAAPIRQAGAESEPSPAQRARETIDIMHRLAGFLFLACPCGVKIKVPPSYTEKEIHCPSCGRALELPRAVQAAAGVFAALGAQTPAESEQMMRERAREAPPLKYTYTPGQWQSFRCACGRTIQLSPTLAATHIPCPGCGRVTIIERN